jgi:hypothetical protein
MAYFLVSKVIIAIAIFLIVNLLGGISIGLGYTQIHHQYRRERYPAFNQVFKIVTPILVTIAIGIIFHTTGHQRFNHHLWLSLVLSWIVRLIYIVLWQKHSLMNMGIFIAQFAVSSLIGIWLYYKLITNPLLMFPSRDNMVSQIWLIVILFLYKSFEDLKLGDDSSAARKHNYILKSYSGFKREFDQEIQRLVSDEITALLVYSIMIVENFNRPKIARVIELLTSPFHKSGTYGIMQVKSSSYLSDSNSVIAGAEIIVSLNEKVKSPTDTERPSWSKDDGYHLNQIIHRTAWLYNNSDSYADEVLEVFNQLLANSKPKPEPITDEKLHNAYFSRGQSRT